MEPARFRIRDAEDPWDSRARAHSASGIRPSEWILSQPSSRGPVCIAYLKEVACPLAGANDPASSHRETCHANDEEPRGGGHLERHAPVPEPVRPGVPWQDLLALLRQGLFGGLRLRRLWLRSRLRLWPDLQLHARVQLRLGVRLAALVLPAASSSDG